CYSYIFVSHRDLHSFPTRRSSDLKGNKSSPLIGMIVSDLIRKFLLSKGISFTMETVFSHSAKLDLIRSATEKGYKVYLYFVSTEDRKSTRLNSSHVKISYAVFCLK